MCTPLEPVLGWGTVQVIVGPVAAASVRAYLETARVELRTLYADSRRRAPLPADLLERFELLLDQWERAAEPGTEFVWRDEFDAEEAHWLVHGFFRVLQCIEERGGPLYDDEQRRPFYVALVSGVLDALERDGELSGSFARDLRARWPFLELV